MFFQLLKNSQRVQNIRNELFTDVRIFLEVCNSGGEWPSLSSM